MKNFEIKDQETGKAYWISRSVAVAGFIFTKIKDELCILAEKRGKGAADNIGCWCCPCGYLDWDETTEEACCREIWEEVGFIVDPYQLKLLEISSDPKESHQNVTIKYKAVISDVTPKTLFGPSGGGEVNEIAEYKWIPLKDMDNYDWCFGHKELILKYEKQ